MRAPLLTIALALGLLLPVVAQATLELPRLFSRGAVLQRDQPMRVWGWATPGTRVTLGFDGAHATAVAGDAGRWDATLPAHVAGGPYVLDVTDGREHRRIGDVLVGDVWLCSGQSNMEFMVSQGRDAAAEEAKANDPSIRQFKIPHSASTTPLKRLQGGSWVSASPATVGQFSAVCWFFARDMQARTSVPQGLVNSSWGGSSIEAWTDAHTGHVDVPALAARIKTNNVAEAAKLGQTQRHLARWPVLHGDVLDAAGKPAWAAEQIDTSSWARIPVPAYWETVGYYDMDGVAWYHTQFNLSAAEAARGITLGLGEVDDSDRSYVNGHLVGATEKQWNLARVYKVPAAVLHAGSNSIAIRVDDLGAGGGIHGLASELYVQPADGSRRSLAGEWLFHPAMPTLVPTESREVTPTLLYNAMIHPLLGYPLRGVVWCQGEANALAGNALAYRDQFKALIESWRAAWKQPRLPFLWVQLANFKAGEDTPQSSPWAELRESQSAALALPATGQAVTIDIGSTETIHPTDKQDVGYRLALVTRRVVFGDKIVDAGPMFRAMHVDGAKAVLSFDTQGEALAVRGGGQIVRGFEVAGSDGHYLPAQARIEGDSVVVWNAKLRQPTAVRYAWSEDPVDADLVDHTGLPASPFRTTKPSEPRRVTR
jgi:sialate O-acetylesterase